MLAHSVVVAPGAAPAHMCIFLHGILGSGANWRSFASRLVGERPEWGALLVDLRLHGESRDVAPPDTVEAAADDLAPLAEAHGVRAIVAHSFGGKVALAYARDHDLDRLFVVDASPGPRPTARGSESTKRVVDLLSELPEDFADRNAFTSWIEARGVDRPTAMWLAMNVRPLTGSTRYVFRLDVPRIRAMLNDYFALDLWPVLESPRGMRETHLVVGTRSDVVDAADRERAARCPRTTVHAVEAGHWVHVDAPDALRAIVARAL